MFNKHPVSAKHTVLVVDDTPANLEVLSEALVSQGYIVSTAIDGERAIKRLHNHRPDLILLDIQMPKMDGFETCQQIKANPDWASIPIIFITALNDAESIVKGFSLGAVDYINKPFREPELLARVKTHLQLQQMTQHLEQQVVERTKALEATMNQLKTSQLQTVKNEKMATLGSLVAGIAHEINNPIGFLSGSINNAKDYVQDLFEYLEIYQQQHPPNEQVTEVAKEVDLEFLLEDLPKLINSMQGATERIQGISTSLRTFSRADTEHKVSANLHEGLDSTLLILKYRLKANEQRPAIEVIRNYGDLPEIECFPGQLNQVFMNILANAIDMFDDMAQQTTFEDLKSNPQKISIWTSFMSNENTVEIKISDNGRGMSEAVRHRIFDYLFTTKGVGEGTGLGLAIARQIVLEKHCGGLEVQSELGQGTKFYIRLPACIESD